MLVRTCRRLIPVALVPWLLVSRSAAAEPKVGTAPASGPASVPSSGPASPSSAARPAPTPPAKASAPAKPAACTVESVQQAGEFCAPCGNHLGSQGRCDHAFAEAEPAWEYRCRSTGAKRWTEVWCRPWTKPGRPPVPSPDEGAAPTPPAAGERRAPARTAPAGTPASG
ncbi:MAG: hypothetical protein U1A78_01470 [Polyangia bacterium]